MEKRHASHVVAAFTPILAPRLKIFFCLFAFFFLRLNIFTSIPSFRGRSKLGQERKSYGQSIILLSCVLGFV